MVLQIEQCYLELESNTDLSLRAGVCPNECDLTRHGKLDGELVFDRFTSMFVTLRAELQ